jgi:Tfp pilus assembly protein PilF
MVAVLIGINFVYLPLLHYGFINYDDPQYILQNPDVTSGLTWHGMVWAFTSGHESNWHPLTWLSHMIDVRVYGLNAGGHHLTNVLLHILNTVLLFALLLQMTGAPGPSMFVAALFGVHPLHVESVAWTSERKDVLSTLFGLLALGAYLRYVRQPGFVRYSVVLLLFAASLMSKPMLVTLPFLFLLIDFWPLGRLTFQPQSNLGSRIWEKVPLLALSALSSIVTFIVQQRGGSMAGVETIPIGARVVNALVAYVTYAGKIFWPTRLAVLYPISSVASDRWIPAALVLLGVSALAIRAARRRPYLTVGWFWYLGTLVPVIGLVQVGRQAFADRYTYIPSVGLFIVVAFASAEVFDRARTQKWSAPVAATAVIAACLWLTNHQLHHWASSNALWEHTLSVTGDNALAHFNLGAALEDQGRLDEAASHYSEALRIEPAYPDAHVNLATALLKRGKPERFDEVPRHLTEALRLRPTFAEAHNAYGIYRLRQGNLADAIAHFSEAIRLKPNYPAAQNNLKTAREWLTRLNAEPK